jgi:hypothetical protein
MPVVGEEFFQKSNGQTNKKRDAEILSKFDEVSKQLIQEDE